MAEGKKSFVLYTDLIHVVKKLPNEQRGKLFLHLLQYVNDLNPETDDILVEIAFEPIKLQLKRDLNQWEEIRVKRSESGKLGGRPKSEEKQTEAKKANGFFEKQTEAKKAVNVTVNDTVNVTVNDNVINDIYTASQSIELFNLNGLKGNFLSKMSQVHSLNILVVTDQLNKWIETNEDQNFKSEKHLQNSFNNWLRNYKPEKKAIPKKFESKIDWDEIKKEMS
jgi:hypothetical protein